LLRPVELAAFDVHSDADAPLRRIRPGAGIALARVDKGLDVRTIEVGAHHAHPLAVAPVELLALRLELELIGSERRPRRNDRRHVTAIAIGREKEAAVGCGASQLAP